GVFVDEGGSAHGLASGRESLPEAGEDEHQRSQPADLVVAGQDADEGGADADEEDRDGQGLAPSDLVSERAEEQTAERTHDEGNAEGREADEQPGDPVAVRYEVFGEDDSCEAVESEVVELDELADAAADEHLLLHARRSACWLNCCGGHQSSFAFTGAVARLEPARSGVSPTIIATPEASVQQIVFDSSID